MKRLALVALGVLAVAPALAPAQRISVGIGFGGPAYYPRPYYGYRYYGPPAVYVAPRPVYVVSPAPVYAAPPAYYPVPVQPVYPAGYYYPQPVAPASTAPPAVPPPPANPTPPPPPPY
jgi:hypothetical protein